MLEMPLFGLQLIGIPLGLLYGNAVEWLVHKYLLHGLGKNKNSFWAFHWHNHHRNSRQGDMIDIDYTKPMSLKNPPGKELWTLLLAAATHIPLLWVAPWFTLTVWYCAFNYHRVHKKSHLDKEWARKKLPWHVDHHLGKNQDMNWCVTRPWFDHLLGTRERFIGTAAEKPKTPKGTVRST